MDKSTFACTYTHDEKYWESHMWVTAEPYVPVKEQSFVKGHKAKHQALQNLTREHEGDITTKRRTELRRKRKKK